MNTTTRYLPLLLCLCAGQALADTPIDLRHAATPDARVSIGNIKGSVSVTGWDRNEVRVTGRLGDGAKPLEITGGDSSLSIKVEAQGKSGWFGWGSDSAMGPSTLEVRVPRGASLDIDVVSAPLDVDGMDGGRIEINTVSGKARVNARTPSLSVNSVSGTVELAGHAERADLETVSGDILAPSLGGEAELQTVSGRIQAAGGPWRKFSMSTVSGDTQLAGGPAPGGSMDIDSMSGDVQLALPANVSARIHASSFSGDLRSDFGSANHSEHGPGSELDATVDGGQGRIHIETFSGDLRIRRQD
ncbi:DUF4097 family beta strand repeat-containing protein [Fulvimonas soli]|jgi:hypothetical protein|uniref:Putative adhesin n=1 Tax=Fulvimonas soli TaxID=155197 RepID=A0A316IN08_9GAMM|nr:DUF4097 family beta strand repeat-containing protein [Fulvimonas soli]PWK88490.1 putative adhesin [Fulvimonas soli]TNY26862.1 hypothetical protein BV497_06400 [Fulvimonas soli]